MAGIDLRVGGRLYFAPGLYYLTSSTEIKKLEDVQINDVANFQTLEIPLTVGFHLINKEALKLGLKAGIEGAYFTYISDISALSDNEYNKLNWGFQFGVGLDVKKITIDLKYDLGNNASFANDFSTGFNPQYNRLHLYLGYVL